MRRLVPLIDGEMYHIYTKSIYAFRIFTNETEYNRMLLTMRFYQWTHVPLSFSKFIDTPEVRGIGFEAAFLKHCEGKVRLVDIHAYCLMPTHLHLILKQMTPDGIALFMGRTLGSYSRFFNLKHNRRGPLWQSRFGNTLITSPLHFETEMRYVHDNPVKAGLAANPSDWPFSSYTSAIPGIAEVNS